MDESLGLYIHIPFCKSKCAYCDFYSLPGMEEWKERYRRALCAHIAETAPLARGYEVDTVYFGGGTPLMLGRDALLSILSLIRKKFHLRRGAEVTVEVNPDSADKKTLSALRRGGFDRLSIGMQSSVNAELAAVGRPHNFEDTCRVVSEARAAKFKNLSLDLIYGLPGQTLQSFRESLNAAIALEPEHISCYGLKVEPGTPLAQRVAAGERLPDDDLQAECYLLAVRHLAANGYAQYEISNFAREGFSSRHNLKYWRGKPYLGFGPGAHSDFGDRRYSFLRDLEGYITAIETGSRILDEDDVIPERERAGEYLMLRLRTTHGVEEWEYRRAYFMDFDPLAALFADFERQGWAERVERRWRFTPEGFLRSNQLIGLLLEAQEKATLPATLRSLQRLEREN